MWLCALHYVISIIVEKADRVTITEEVYNEDTHRPSQCMHTFSSSRWITNWLWTDCMSFRNAFAMTQYSDGWSLGTFFLKEPSGPTGLCTVFYLHSGQRQWEPNGGRDRETGIFCVCLLGIGVREWTHIHLQLVS